MKDESMKHNRLNINEERSFELLYTDVRSIIEKARENAVRSVDFCRVQMYWNLGRRIFEEEQQGKERADYGKYILKNLSVRLMPEFGSGFGVRQLEQSRQFYRTYPNTNTLRSQLNWSQYRRLIQIDDPDKESVLSVARKQRIPELPAEVIKDPMVLEFLGLHRESSYYEKDLEGAIISHLTEFLLEMGKGFSFVARQKRILLEDDEFFADLVFYNRLLRCHVVIELKTGKLTHQDLGQLQMYVNYYDRNEKLPDENPTIGILLCTAKNDTVVKMTLPESNKTILASEYQLYLPTTEELVNEIDTIKKLTEQRKEDEV